VHALLQSAGWEVSHGRVLRIWRREGLRVPQKQPKRGRLWLNDGSCIRLRPEHPNHVWSWENGYCESFNGKLRDELLNGELFYTLREAQVLIEQWRVYYNTIRPHSSLHYRPPAPETLLPKEALPYQLKAA